mgnify:CR=1 FL=1
MLFFPKDYTIWKRGEKEHKMNMSELVREIEIKRKALDVEAGKNIWTPECYQMSLQLDKLIETYMQCKEEVQL